MSSPGSSPRFDQSVPLPGSQQTLPTGERIAEPAAADQSVLVTLMLRRPPGAPSEQDLLSGRYSPSSRDAAQNALRATPADLAAVTTAMRAAGLNIVQADADSRRVQVEGTPAQMTAAFGVHLSWIEAPTGQRHLGYEGSIYLPQSLDGIVTAVLGLSQRPIAQPR